MRDRWSRHASFPFPARFVSILSLLCRVLFACPFSFSGIVSGYEHLFSPKNTQVTTPHKESRSTTGEIMRLRRAAGYAIIGLCCLFSSACFSIEQEIFLNADGSGDVVVFISVPDLPEKAGGAEVSKKNPAETLSDFKKELTTALPPGITVKQIKDVKQNGVQSIYAVFHFTKLEEIQRVLANFGKSSLKDGDIGSDPEWSIRVEKTAGRTSYNQKFRLDVDAKAKAGIKAEVTVNGQPQKVEQKPEDDKASKEMEEQLKPLILSIVRMRFVLHTPTPITETNADIVLNERTAVWNCSLAAFAKDKKPIEMKATF